MQQSLWLDELNVVRFIAFPSLDSSFFNALRNEPHPPLYILLLWTYGSMAGTGEFWLRLSSAFFGALAVLACYFAFKRVFGWKVALVTTALFGMAPVGLYEAQNLRPYSLVFLLAILSTVAFVQYVGLARIHGSLSGGLPAVTVSNLLLCFDSLLGHLLLRRTGDLSGCVSSQREGVGEGFARYGRLRACSRPGTRLVRLVPVDLRPWRNLKPKGGPSLILCRQFVHSSDNRQVWC